MVEEVPQVGACLEHLSQDVSFVLLTLLVCKLDQLDHENVGLADQEFLLQAMQVSNLNSCF